MSRADSAGTPFSRSPVPIQPPRDAQANKITKARRSVCTRGLRASRHCKPIGMLEPYSLPWFVDGRSRCDLARCLLFCMTDLGMNLHRVDRNNANDLYDAGRHILDLLGLIVLPNVMNADGGRRGGNISTIAAGICGPGRADGNEWRRVHLCQALDSHQAERGVGHHTV